jgi:hypothetical protein
MEWINYDLQRKTTIIDNMININNTKVWSLKRKSYPITNKSKSIAIVCVQC